MHNVFKQICNQSVQTFEINFAKTSGTSEVPFLFPFFITNVITTLPVFFNILPDALNLADSRHAPASGIIHKVVIVGRLTRYAGFYQPLSQMLAGIYKIRHWVA